MLPSSSFENVYLDARPRASCTSCRLIIATHVIQAKMASSTSQIGG